MRIAEEVLEYVRVLIWPGLVLVVVVLLRSNIASWLNNFADLLKRDDVETETKFSAGGIEISSRIASAAHQQLLANSNAGVSDLGSDEPGISSTTGAPQLGTVAQVPVTQGGPPVARIATAWDSVVAAVARQTVAHPAVAISGRTGSTAAALSLQGVLPAGVSSSVQVLDNIFEQVLRSSPSDIDDSAADAFVALADNTLSQIAQVNL